MKEVYIEDEKDNAAFAEEAAKHFKDNPAHFTYADGDPEQGKLLAIRWNPMAVLIVKLHDDYEPLCYTVGQFIGGDLPPLEMHFFQ